MIALLLGLLLVGAASTCATAVLRPQGAVAFCLGVAVVMAAEIVVISHALSLVDAYERRWFLVAAAVLALAAGAAVLAVRPPWPSVRLGAAARDVLSDRVVAVLAAVVVTEFAYLIALALFTPPTEYDAVTYHLTRAVLWIQQGSVGPIAGVTDTRINDLPPNAEILQGATMLLSGSIRFTGLVQLASLLAAVVAVYGTASRIGLDRRSAAFGALVFPTLTVVALQAPTALNDLVVAALVAIVAFFVLGRSTREFALAAGALALVVGTKPTALLAVPVLFVLCLLTTRGRRLGWALLAGLVGLVVGGTWYVLVNGPAGEGSFGETGRSEGLSDGVVAIAARTTRYAVETLEVPARGKDVVLYAIAAGVVLIGGLALRRGAAVVVGTAALAFLPVVLPGAERVLHSVYWNGWTLVGYQSATGLDPIRDSFSASNLASWYGPAGLALTLAALVLVTRRAARGTMPWAAVVLAWAPVALLVASAIAVTFHPFNGRYVMPGVVLGAATWGVVRVSQRAAMATVTVAAATAFLALVNFQERPSGISLLEPSIHPSVWTLPRAWSQSIQPEVSRLIEFLDANALSGSTVAVTRDQVVYPFTYVGWPGIDHPIVYADTLGEATRTNAAWAVLSARAGCARGWKLALRSEPWAVYRRAPNARCQTR